MGRRWALGALTAAALVLGASTSGSADTPQGALTAAMQKTALAKTAHVAVDQKFSAADRTIQSNVTGTLARGDQDLTSSGDGGESRRVAVGQSMYQRRPNTPDSPWRISPRQAPASDQAFGTLMLADGTSLSDPKLYKNAVDAGTEQLPQGLARKVTADLDMPTVAASLLLAAPDQARLAQMQGRVTLWISTTDGSLLRHSLVITIQGANGPEKIETTIDLSDLDAPLVVTAP